jgi:hypothetical protein
VFQDKLGLLVSKGNQIGAQTGDDEKKWGGSQQVHKMNSPEQPCNFIQN